MTFESAFAEVATLIENFRVREAEYLNPRYQESQGLKSHIDKFFVAFGWDVYHQKQTNHREQEVTIEKIRTARNASLRNERESEQLQRKCGYLDTEIDRLVYQLYGLAEEETVRARRRDEL